MARLGGYFGVDPGIAAHPKALSLFIHIWLLYCGATKRLASRSLPEETPGPSNPLLRREAMFLTTILRGIMHVVDAVQAANQRKAKREVARVAGRNGGARTERKSGQAASWSR